MEELENRLKSIIGAYYGVKSMDEYDLKEYVLNDIKIYMDNFIEANNINNFDIDKENEFIKNNVSLINKLQDSLVILSNMNASLELILLIKNKIRKLKK